MPRRRKDVEQIGLGVSMIRWKWIELEMGRAVKKGPDSRRQQRRWAFVDSPGLKECDDKRNIMRYVKRVLRYFKIAYLLLASVVLVGCSHTVEKDAQATAAGTSGSKIDYAQHGQWGKVSGPSEERENTIVSEDGQSPKDQGTQQAKDDATQEGPQSVEGNTEAEKVNDVKPTDGFKKGESRGQTASTCPAPKFSQTPGNYTSDESQIDCKLLFDALGICGDFTWIQHHDLARFSPGAVCIYLWDKADPQSPPRLDDRGHELSLRMSMPEMDHGDVIPTLRRLKAGIWLAYNMVFPMMGTWQAEFSLKRPSDNFVNRFGLGVIVEKESAAIDWDNY